METAQRGTGGYGDAGSPLSGWKGRRAVLRAGFGCVIALQVFSTVEAYRIQGGVADQHIEIYKHYVEQDEALSQLRRNSLLGSNYVRDFFLSAGPDRVEVFKRQLQELQEQNREALELLDRLQSPDREWVSPRATVEEYWRVFEPVADNMQHITAAVAYDFIQREVTPRRTAAYAALRQLTAWSQKDLQKRELDFALGRKAAVQRLAMLLGVCVVFAFLVAWLSMRHAENLGRQTARHYMEVVDAKRELQQLSTRLLEIQEEERRRLSRGLHDEIGQTLTALRIEISHALTKAETAELRERLERARGLAERTVQTVRDISVVLRPALLDDLGLVPALQWQLEDFARRSGISCEFNETGVEDALPDSIKTCVYRVVQEALNNCEKHAAASKLCVTLHQRTDSLLVEVRDDGRGFEADAAGMPLRRDGIGLVGMRERAARLGGQLVFESAPGHGTRITLEIPLPDLNRPQQAAQTAIGI